MFSNFTKSESVYISMSFAMIYINKTLTKRPKSRSFMTSLTIPQATRPVGIRESPATAAIAWAIRREPVPARCLSGGRGGH